MSQRRASDHLRLEPRAHRQSRLRCRVLAAELALEGGPQPDAFGVDAFAVYVAGFFAALAGLPPPEGAPQVRGFQLAQLEVALPWAGRTLGLTIES